MDVDRHAVLDVFHEGLLQGLGDFPVIDEGIDFEILLEAPDIQIGGTYRGHRSICHQSLGVEVALLVEIDFDTCHQHVFDVASCRKRDKDSAVTLDRDYEPHVDS